MATRRYYIATLPVEHINGKMDQVSNVVHNTPNPPAVPVDGFWYGYRPYWSSRSFFGIRRNPRNLSTNPYTQDELEQRTLFTDSIAAVNAAWSDLTKRDKCLQEFYTSNFSTPRGFAVHETYLNQGVWPSRWE